MLHSLFLKLKLRWECINVSSKSKTKVYSLSDFIGGKKYLFCFELSILFYSILLF